MSKTILDYAEVVDSLHQTPEYQESGYPMVRIVDVNDDFLDLSACFKVSADKLREHNKNHTPQQGDIIITRVGSFGMLGYVDTKEPFCLGQNIAIISPYEESHFLYYYLKSPYIQAIIHGNSGGSSYKCISLEEIRKLPVEIEGLNCKKIGEILYCLDSKIQVNRKICAVLESVAKTLYDYWFTQFDFPDENGKPYRSSGGEMVWNEQLKREIPKGWEIGAVSDLMKIENTSVNPQKLGNTVMEHYSIPAFDMDHNPAYEKANTIESGKYSVAPECILTSKLNPHFKRLWDPYCDTKNAICSTEFIVYRPRAAWTRPFCYAVLNSDAFYTHMAGKAIASTGSRKRIQPDVSASFVLAIPDKKTMRTFVELYAPIMEKQKALYKENRELTKLRDWLLPMLMNGQATVE